MQSVPVGQLGLIVLTIRLNECLDVSHGLLNLLFHPVHQGEVPSALR